MKKRKLKKLAAKYVKYSYAGGRRDEGKIAKIMADLKSLPRSQSIYIISKFLKGVRKREGENTLLIESAVPLTRQQLDLVFKTLKKDFAITEVKNVVNPALLGGFKVRIGDMAADYSTLGKIQVLKEVITA